MAFHPKRSTLTRKNKFIGSMTFGGSVLAKTEKASRKKILICDPHMGQICKYNSCSFGHSYGG